MDKIDLASGNFRCLTVSRFFSPSVCNCDLAQSGFFQKKGEYICTADYQRLYGTRCDRCDSFITGEVVSALGRTYHPKCFVCSVCRYVVTVLPHTQIGFAPP
ncbi:Actin-binding LIM protein 3 [Goodea atripinnis]|uniref:Actin-binding LIM protein 3 n=1 Tax=Goodea atripinnis TaxID=208336 RepID=A0ABV0PV77_9TELE